MLIFFVAVIAGVALIAGTMAAICRRITHSNKWSLVSGTLSIPILICVSLLHWIMTMDAIDTAPGNILIGSSILLAVATPTALLASLVTTRFLTRRASRNVR